MVFRRAPDGVLLLRQLVVAVYAPAQVESVSGGVRGVVVSEYGGQQKRYPIANGDIASALQQAAQDGFAQTDTPYKAQIDWGYRNMTLSLSYTQKIPGFTALPSAAQARKLAAARMPAEELQTVSLAKEGTVYGPLTYQKYAGTLAGQAVDIEVWPVPNTSEYIAELSFKAPTYTDAVKKRKKIQQLLETQQIVKAEDSLKTTKILNSTSNL